MIGQKVNAGDNFKNRASILLAPCICDSFIGNVFLTTQHVTHLPQLGFGISDKKIIPRKTQLMEQMFISDGIPAVPRNRKFSEFRSEPFRGRENNLEFRSLEQE
jgi:hypothetical protein